MQNKEINKKNLKKFLQQNKNRMVIPQIQRDFVWKEPQIELLFDSIYKKLFIGMFWLWEPSQKEIRKIEYFKLPETFTNDYSLQKCEVKNPIAVIDGQQRLTSISIGIHGEFKGKKLYFNTKDHNFKFLRDKELKQEENNYICVQKIFAKTAKDTRKDEKVAKEIRDIFNETKIITYTIRGKKLEHIIDIFRRVNKGGTQLTNSQDLMTRLSSSWKECRKSFEELRKDKNIKNINITNDFIIKTCLFCLVDDVKIKIHFDKQDDKLITNIQNNWDKISSSIKQLAKDLEASGFDNSNITTYNALIPLVYLKFKKVKISGEELKQYLYRVCLLRKFSANTDKLLNDIKEAFNNRKTLRHLINTYKASDKDISKILDLKKGKYTKLALKLLYEYDSSSKYKDDDHMHAADFFEEDNFKEEIRKELGSNRKKIGKILDQFQDWQEKYNTLPNLQPLLYSMNRSKRRKSLEQYAKNLKGKKQKECFYKFLNENISLKLCNFLKFYKNRRNKMKEKLKKELAKTIK